MHWLQVLSGFMLNVFIICSSVRVFVAKTSYFYFYFFKDILQFMSATMQLCFMQKESKGHLQACKAAQTVGLCTEH